MDVSVAKLVGISNFLTAFSAGALALATSACSDATGVGGDYEIDGVSSVAEPVWGGGQVAGGHGAVELVIQYGGSQQTTCSGVIISQHVGLTAGHCFDRPLGTALTGTVAMHVSYTENGTSWYCITGPSDGTNGKCTQFKNVLIKRLGAGITPERDFAVMVYRGVGRPRPGGPGPLQWAGWTNGFNDFRGLLVDPGDSFGYSFWGRGVSSNSGTGAGTMRTFNDAVDWMGSQHFFTDAGDKRTCSGDSGGPYLFRNANTHVMGIHSHSEHADGDACTGKNILFTGKQRANRMIRSHVPFINDFANASLVGSPHTSCRETSIQHFWCGP
ncbi:MAG TPA: trypsin-like serine protease [Polyangiaceae bacterium]|nr:trypsin-like serine protease [Polyangiaceae bacterium]